MKDRERPVSTAALAAAQLRPEQLVAAEEVEWQETIIVVKTVEVSPFLIAVNAVIGGVNIEDDLFWRGVKRFDEEFDEEFGEGGVFFGCDSIFESGKGGWRTEGRIFIGIILDGGKEGGIVSEVFLIVNISNCKCLRRKFVGEGVYSPQIIIRRESVRFSIFGRCRRTWCRPKAI